MRERARFVPAVWLMSLAIIYSALAFAPVSWTSQQIGVTVGLVSVTAFFVALAVAYGVILQGAPRPPIVTPSSLWLSTALLFASSAAFERARYALRRAWIGQYRMQLDLTTFAGVAFLISQLAAWSDLFSQGVYVRANPHGSVFYAFTGLHALHLAGGLAALFWLRRRGRLLRTEMESQLRRHRMNAKTAAIYWHFMGLLWIVLFTLLLTWNQE